VKVFCPLGKILVDFPPPRPIRLGVDDERWRTEMNITVDGKTAVLALTNATWNLQVGRKEFCIAGQHIDWPTIMARVLHIMGASPTSTVSIVP
jgi:hypothetical protein